MKLFFLLIVLSCLLLSSSDCSSKKPERLKGRLELAGICMNYTIKIIEGDIDPSLVNTKWTDETTGKKYINVFKLGNPCSFPSTIKQGDEFYFTLDSTKQQDCIVCEAYYPTPSQAIAIKVEN